MNTTATTEFKVWRTIKLGTFSDNEALIQALLTAERGEMCVEGKIKEGRNGPILDEQYREQHYLPLLRRIKLSPVLAEVDLVKVTKSMLGLEGRVPIKKVWDLAVEQGLELCPREAGPQLALQWEGREEENLRLAMETFPGDWSLPERPPCTFSVGVSFGQVGFGSSYGPGAPHGNDNDYHDDNIWVFVKPRKQETAV